MTCFQPLYFELPFGFIWRFRQQLSSIYYRPLNHPPPSIFPLSLHSLITQRLKQRTGNRYERPIVLLDCIAWSRSLLAHSTPIKPNDAWDSFRLENKKILNQYPAECASPATEFPRGFSSGCEGVRDPLCFYRLRYPIPFGRSLASGRALSCIRPLGKTL